MKVIYVVSIKKKDSYMDPIKFKFKDSEFASIFAESAKTKSESDIDVSISFEIEKKAEIISMPEDIEFVDDVSEIEGESK